MISSEFVKKGKVRQHFIPQFYLRNFGLKLYCFDKNKEEKFESTPDNIAVKPDFYGGEYEGLPSLETIFSQIENKHSEAIRRLIEEKNYYKLSESDKISICEFFAFQFLRTEAMKNNIKHLNEYFYNIVAEQIIPKESKITLTDLGSVSRHLNSIQDYQKFAVLFYNMKFIIIINHTPIPFWVSDNPITRQNEYDRHPFGTLGIANRGIQIHLPINPSIMIWAVDPTLFHYFPNTFDTYTKQHIIRENFLQLKFATRFVYSNTNRFHLVKPMLKNNPHFKKGNSSHHEILVGHSKKDTIFMTTERNDQWPIQNGKEMMGKLDTWMEPKLVDDLFKK